MFADTILGIGRTSIFESAVDSEIESITPDTVEECAGDPFEFLTAAYYESQLDMVTINQAIMVCEYAYLKENGQEMVYEANVVTKMFSTVGEKIKEAWKKICQFFKSIYDWLDGVIRNDKKFVEKYESKIADIKSVDIGKINGYTYTTSGSSVSDDGSSVSDAAKKMLENLKSNALEQNTVLGANDVNTEELLNSIRGNLVGEASVSASDIGDKLTKYFRGKDLSSSTFSGSELKAMLKVISDTKTTKANLKVIYTDCKSTIDALLKTAKQSEKAAAKTSENGKDDVTAKGWHVVATILNSLTGLTTMVNNKACKALTAHNRQCRAIITKAVSKSAEAKKDSEKKTSTGESASMIDSVFESFGL